MKMLLLLVAGAVIALAAFFAMDNMSEYLTEQYYKKSNYATIRNQQVVEELQTYITSEKVSSRDTEKLSQWVQKQKLVSVMIYKDGIQVFDSNYPDEEIWDEEIDLEYYDWVSYDTVVFTDGTAKISVTGAYQYQVYSYIRLIEMGISFCVFLIIVLAGIRKKMTYIRLLSDEVEVLEGGGLDHPITKKGEDELSVLAEGLESMRRSFLEIRQMEEEKYIENQRVFTEMSHDLRTPVTSILLYTEILKTGKYQNAEQAVGYIEKIGKKAMEIKQRTDQLMAFSMKPKGKYTTVMKTGLLKDVFYDLLSESCGYLEHSGFRLDLNLQWPDVFIQYSADYVIRVIDNIVSNIIKYADQSDVIILASTRAEMQIGFLFQNRVICHEKEQDSMGIGMQSIRSMMTEMGGNCRFDCTGQYYWIEIMFQII